MSFENKIALAAYYKGEGLNNAQISQLLRVDVSSVSRYLKQADENGWLRHKIDVRLPRELDRAVRAAVRAIQLEDDLFHLFFSGRHGATRNRFIRREGLVVVRRLPHASTAFAKTARAVRTRKNAEKLQTMMMSIEGARLLLDLISTRKRNRPAVLGTTWGRGTGGVVECLAEMSLPQIHRLLVVPLQGGVGRSVSSDASSAYYPNILAERLSLLFGSRRAPALITQPAYIQAETATAVKAEGLQAIWRFIEADHSFQQASAAYQKLDVALIGIGGLEQGAWAVTSGYLPNANVVSALREEGACGDIACRFFRDRAEDPIEGWGEQVPGAETIRQTNRRAIGIALSTLRDRVSAGARVLAIAGGNAGVKADAIRAAVASGFITDLVTDEETALAILSRSRNVQRLYKSA
jgi:DNA-binding transcriptional regulator LsrR (DeoR family)